jgi:aarF domain-containing kinase
VTFTSEKAREIAQETGAVFEDWQNVPIGSASIGQVYKARLNGEDVAVKVQGDDVERQFRVDMRQLRRFCEFALPQFVAPLREIEAQFMTEFDYREEAKNLRRVRDNLMKSPWAGKVVVPKPFEEYCSKRVLVMEYLKGVKLTDLLEGFVKEESIKQGKDANEVLSEYTEQLRVMESFNNTWFEYFKRTYVITCHMILSGFTCENGFKIFTNSLPINHPFFNFSLTINT